MDSGYVNNRFVCSLAVIYLRFTQMDVINMISKVAGLPDAEVAWPDKEFQPGHKYFISGCVPMSPSWRFACVD